MTDPLDLAERAGLPDALRTLVEAFPRETWEAHPRFAGLVAFWLERHAGFRKLSEAICQDAQAAVDGQLAPDMMRRRLSRYGGMMVQELHMHHHIEDSHYFPVLQTRETTLVRGFEVLDKDHDAMAGLLQRFAEGANGVLRQEIEAGVFLDEARAFQSLLLRHLEDEEDLVVPVILKHGFEGLD